MLFVWFASLTLALALGAPTQAREVAHHNGANIQRPLFSADASLLSYEAHIVDQRVIELYVGDAEGKQFERVRPQSQVALAGLAAGFTTTSRSAVTHELSFSPPQYKQYVYSASQSTADYNLYLSGVIGPIGSAPGTDGGPSWSPNGKWIVFSSARTGQGDLYLLDVAGIEAPPRQLTFAPQSAELYPAWSPDSLKLVYVGRGTVGDNLWLLPTTGGKPLQLTHWSGSQLHPTFSPDGQWVAFYADRNHDKLFDLYVVPARTQSTPTLVARDVVPSSSGPTWSPDSQHLVFVCNDDKRFDPLCVVSPSSPLGVRTLDVGTVGHTDLALAQTPFGMLRLAVVAQGIRGDSERTFKRLFVVDLAQL